VVTLAWIGLGWGNAVAATVHEHAALPTATPEAAVPQPTGTETLAQQVDALRAEVASVRSALAEGARAAEPPPWAAQMQEQLDRRLERMAEMQERLAARIETPTPRLDEPIVLFTVAGCTLLLGFVVGRGVQRRSSRRDVRLRL
jgi:predicted trehalose synthase